MTIAIAANSLILYRAQLDHSAVRLLGVCSDSTKRRREAASVIRTHAVD